MSEQPGNGPLRDRVVRVLGAINVLVALPIAAGAVDSILPPVFTQYKWLIIIGLLCSATPAVISALRAQRREAREKELAALTWLPEKLASEVRKRWTSERGDRKLNESDLMDVYWHVVDTDIVSPEAISRSIALQGLAIPSEDDRTLDKIADLFRSTQTHQLVILGAPGSGKTSVALRLTLELLGNSDVPDSVPVMVSLNDWDPVEEDLETWLVSRICRDYAISADPKRGPAKALRSLLGKARIIAVLDGLDEMPEAWRRDAIGRIDAAAAGGLHLILTCRTADYKAAVKASSKFIRTALLIQLEPVKPGDARRYLRNQILGGDARWNRVIDAIESDTASPAKEALSKPLMLWLAVEAFRDPQTKPDMLLRKRYRKPQEIEALLLDRYLDVQYPTAKPPFGSELTYYDPIRAKAWLRFFAKQLSYSDKKDVNWWLFAADLGVVQRIIAGVIIGLIMGVIGGLLFGISNPPAFSFALTCSLSIAVGVSIGIKGVPPTCAQVIIATKGSFRWNWQRLGGGLLLGLIAYIGLSVAGSGELGTFFLAMGLLLGVFLMITDTPDTVNAISPNALLANDRIAFFVYVAAGTVLGLAGGAFVTIIGARFPAWLAGALAGALAGGLMGEHVRGLTGAVVGAIGLGSIDAGAGLLTSQQITGSVGMVFGGLIFGVSCALASALASTSYGWFLIFRLYSIRSRRVPFHVMQFLEDARLRMVLRQMGGSYQFTHATMQERLAEADSASPAKRTA